MRRRGHGPAEAQDLTQGFFVHLLETRILLRADPDKGRLRSFLLGSLKRFLDQAQAHEGTLKRGGAYGFVTLDEERVATETRALDDGPVPAGVGEDRLFEQRWADALVWRALARLRVESATTGQTELLEALLPLMTGKPPLPDQAALAARFHLPAATLRSHVHRMRGRYREALRAEIGHTVFTRAEIDEKLRHL